MKIIKGEINNIDHIVISDPIYEKDVSCRYESSNFIEGKWEAEIKTSIEEIDNMLEFKIELKPEYYSKNDIVSKRNTVKMLDIGMDSACFSVGVNEKAQEILDSKDEWQPECSITTGYDGMIGFVNEVKDQNNKVLYLSFRGSIDADLITQEELSSYFINQLEISSLLKEHN